MIDVIDRAARHSRRALVEVHPATDRALRVPINWYARSWIRGSSLIASLRYDAPIVPTRLYLVDPNSIERSVSWNRISSDRKADEHPRFRVPKYRLAGRIFDGEWDIAADRFSESTIYASFLERFEDSVPWPETRFYAETLAAIRQGARPWGCASRKDLDNRCDSLDRLYEQMATDGYKTQRELDGRQSSDSNGRRDYDVIWNEISVHIGRSGEFIFHDGRNRLAIARILGLETIPAVILVRHEMWQRMRDRVSRGELSPEELALDLRPHPDVSELF